MRKTVRIIAAAIFCLTAAVTSGLWAANQASENKKILVCIDYGGVLPSRTVEATLVGEKTALEILQAVATVETHPVGQYVFVTSIDGVAGKRGQMAWYYTLDDKSPEELAYTKAITGREGVIKWAYKKDVCSGKVDGKPKAQKE